jgi:hypothetical protein
MKATSIFLWLLIFSVLFLLSSCKTTTHYSAAHGYSKINTISNQKTNPPSSFYKGYQQPIVIPAGEFNRGIGWLSVDEIVYMTNSQNGSILYIHDLKNGLSKKLYESEYPIISSVISPDNKNIIIHSSPTTYEGLITIINNQGKSLFTETFPSVEIVFEWNRNSPGQLLITTFKEDWSFTNYLFNMDKMAYHQVEIRKPFSKWTGKNKLAYLDWNENDISLLAPLVQKELNQDEDVLKNKVYYFDSFLDKMLVISVNQLEQLANYQFYTHDMAEVKSLKLPILTNYSGWIIPYYDLISDQKHFLSMLPYESENADNYRDGFQLVSFDLESNKKEVILDHIENMPITCSPDGRYCLVGYQFEQILDLQNKTLIPLFESIQ